MGFIKSKKTYAILMNNEEGKKIVEEASNLDQKTLDKKIDDFFQNSNTTQSENELKRPDEWTKTIKDLINVDEPYMKQVGKILEKGVLYNGEYKITYNDAKTIRDILIADKDPYEIENTDLYKWAINKAESIERPDIEDKGLITKAENEFYNKITNGKNGLQYKGNNLYVITGLPASGKSSGDEMKKVLTTSIELDSDIAKKVDCLQDYYQGGLGAEAVHLFSKIVMKNVGERLQREGYNIALPIIGNDEETIVKKSKVFLDNGYNGTIIHKSLPNKESTKRMIVRWITTGRLIPLSVMKEYDDNPTKTYSRIKENGGIIDGYKFRIR